MAAYRFPCASEERAGVVLLIAINESIYLFRCRRYDLNTCSLCQPSNSGFGHSAWLPGNAIAKPSSG